jgi:hypothetical protein
MFFSETGLPALVGSLQPVLLTVESKKIQPLRHEEHEGFHEGSPLFPYWLRVGAALRVILRDLRAFVVQSFSDWSGNTSGVVCQEAFIASPCAGSGSAHFGRRV